MPNLDLIRFIDQLGRDKDIDRDVIFDALETAMLSALRKKYSHTGEVTFSINRDTGDLHAEVEGEEVQPDQLGRISAQIAKQVIIQKIRESERDVVFSDYEGRKGEIVSGNVQRFEGQNIIVNLGRTEGVLPKQEQVREEHYKVGDRVRAYITDVKKMGQKVRIILSRIHPDLVRRLFELEVPEINERIIEIVTLQREAGYRTKVAVSSFDPKVDCVGACVGVRGSRIKSIIDELNGEKIDIIRWNESSEVLIKNALKPAEVAEISLDRPHKKAWVLVEDDQLSLAIGKRGQNVRLASKLVGWEIDIITRSQERERAAKAVADFESLEGSSPELARRLYLAGFFSIDDLLYRGTDALQHIDEMGQPAADRILASGRLLVVTREAAKIEAAKAAAAARVVAAAEAKAAIATAAEGGAPVEAGPGEESGAGENFASGGEAGEVEPTEEADASTKEAPTGGALTDGPQGSLDSGSLGSGSLGSGSLDSGSLGSGSLGSGSLGSGSLDSGSLGSGSLGSGSLGSGSLGSGSLGSGSLGSGSLGSGSLGSGSLGSGSLGSGSLGSGSLGSGPHGS